MQRRAVIDVGTNSVKLLVADVDGVSVMPVFEGSEQTRLGAGFFETRILQPGSIAKTATSVAAFAAKAQGMKSASVRVIATSAARDALNSDDLTGAIRAASGLEVEIISGDTEADWSYRGVMTDAKLANHPLLLLDVGGGSTEFILGSGMQANFQASFQIGTVRLLEKMPPHDAPRAVELECMRVFVREFLQREVIPQLKPHLDEPGISEESSGRLLVGTGGTASILARMQGRLATFDREQIEGMRIRAESLRGRVEQLWSLPLEERKKIPGLPANRADVILAGVVIFEGVMRELGFDELRITTRGLRFAALMD